MYTNEDVSALITQVVNEAVAKAIARQPSEMTGIVKRVGGDTYVQIGESGPLAPFLSTVAVNEGDAVRVRVEGHRAIVTGNVSSPAVDTKSLQHITGAVNCFEETDQGLVIGTKSATGAWTGARTLYGASAIVLLDASGNPMATYAVNGISMGGCEMKTGPEAAGFGLNIFSSAGPICVSASAFQYPQGTAGTSLQPQPPYLESSSEAVGMHTEYLVTDADGPVGKGDNAVWVDADGVHIEGKVFHNGEEVSL